MSYTKTWDMPERTTEFVRRREERLRPALSSVVVVFITAQMLYEDSLGRGDPVNATGADREFRQDTVAAVLADFDKLATLTSARRSKPYVFNRADAYLTEDLNDGQVYCGVRAVNPSAKEVA